MKKTGEHKGGDVKGGERTEVGRYVVPVEVVAAPENIVHHHQQEQGMPEGGTTFTGEQSFVDALNPEKKKRRRGHGDKEKG